MNDSKIVISKLNNRPFVFEFKDGNILRLYPFNDSQLRIGVILIARIKDIKDDLECCFVQISDKTVAFLSYEDMNPNYLLNRRYDGKFKQGDEILVRIKRMPIGSKPYSVSMDIEIAGRYCVFSDKERGIGYSKKIKKEDLDKLKTIISDNNVSFDNCHCLIRTQAKEISEGIISEIKETYAIYKSIIDNMNSRTLFSVLYKPDEEWYERILANNSFDTEIITDLEDVYDLLISKNKFLAVRKYTEENISLKALFSLEKAYVLATNEKVNLSCGAYLIINPTEALTVIDVNSGKYIGNKKKEDYVSKVNEEACYEIARQLELRNISGIIIVDFINCSKEDEKQLIALMRNLTLKASCKIVIEGFTRLGLMELTRQKKYVSIYDNLSL